MLPPPPQGHPGWANGGGGRGDGLMNFLSAFEFKGYSHDIMAIESEIYVKMIYNEVCISWGLVLGHTFARFLWENKSQMSSYHQRRNPWQRVWLFPQSTHRVAMADFCRTFHRDGKISPGWWEWGVARLPPFTLFTITYKVSVYRSTFQLRGQIHSSYFISTPYMYSVAIPSIFTMKPLFSFLPSDKTIDLLLVT